jgi:hypothetical protein
VEFSYNNGYQESLKMSPFEALYGRKSNIPISWDNTLTIYVERNGTKSGKDQVEFESSTG